MTDHERKAREIAEKHCGQVSEYLGPDLEAQMGIYLSQDIATALKEAEQAGIDKGQKLTHTNMRLGRTVNVDAEKKAKEILGNLDPTRYDNHKIIAKALTEAKAEEREACARVAQEAEVKWPNPKPMSVEFVFRSSIAQAIRERNK